MAETLTAAPEPGPGDMFLPRADPPGPRGLAGFAWAVLKLTGVLLLVPAVIAVTLLATGFEPEEPGNMGSVRMAFDASPLALVAMLVMVGILEEAAFRVLPLGLALWATRRLRLSPAWRTGVLAFMTLATSALFGLAHGNVQALMFQGVGGIVFALGFLRYAQLRGWWYGALVVMAAHTLYDLAVISALRGMAAFLGQALPFT